MQPKPTHKLDVQNSPKNKDITNSAWIWWLMSTFIEHDFINLNAQCAEGGGGGGVNTEHTVNDKLDV